MKRLALAHGLMRYLPFALRRAADKSARLVFSFALLLTAWPAAAQVFEGTAFAYQGELRQSNAPFSGSVDMVFTLYDSAAGVNVIGTPISLTGANAVAVVNGIFTVTLDFGGSSFMTMTDDARWLEVKVGSDTLSPRTKIENAPYALTSQLAYSVVAGSIGTTQINAAQVQRRVTNSCASGSSISMINADGTVSCQSAGSGTITSVSGSNGVVASTASGAVSLSADTSFVQKRVSGTCSSGKSISTVNADGSVACVSAGSSFTLPYSATQANAGPLINITNIDTSAASTALQGTTNSTAAHASAVEGIVSSTAPGLYSAGVLGSNNSTSGNGIGVYGTQAGSGPGVEGDSASGSGVVGISPSGQGVLGSSTSGNGVIGASTSGYGVYATSNTGIPLVAYNSNSSSVNDAIFASTTGSGNGVAALAASGTGVSAQSSSGVGLYANSSSNNAAQIVNTNSSNISSPLYVETNNATVAGIQSNAINQGVSAHASGPGGYGIAGYSTETTTAFGGCCPLTGPAGVYGQAAAPGGIGVHGAATDTSGTGASYGVVGEAAAAAGAGLFGRAVNGTGVIAVGSEGLYTSGQPAIYANGQVGVNTFPSNPDIELTVTSANSGNTAADITLLPYHISNGFDISVSGTGPNDVNFGIYKTDGSGYSQYLGIDASGNLNIAGSNAYKVGGSATWITSSDRRIKQDIHPVYGAVDTLLKLRPVSYHYTPEYRAMENNLPDKPNMGFIAQEFREVFPEAVSSTGKPVPGAPAGDAPILAVDTNPALITTVAAVQELAVESLDRSDQIAKLRAENAQLQSALQQERANLQQISERLSRLEQAKQ